MASGEASEESNVIRFEVKLDKEPSFYRAESEVKGINGYPLKLRALVWNEHEDMQVELVCDRGLMGYDVWECEVKGAITCVKRTDRAQSQRMVFKHSLSHDSHYAYIMGVPYLARMAVDKCYAVDRKILFEARIDAVKGNADRFRKRRQIDLLSPSKYSDVALIVEGKKFYVGKKILAHASLYFEATFFGKFKESQEKEIVIDEVEAENFLTALQLIYDTGKVTDYNFAYLYQIGDRFDIPKVRIMVETRLIEKPERFGNTRLFLSDQFNLLDLQRLCLEDVSYHQEINSLWYIKYSKELKDAIAEKKNNPGKRADRSSFTDRFNKMPQRNFESQSKISDTILIVDGKKFYISKQILAHASSYFEKLLYDENKDSNEIEIAMENVSSEEFLVLLEYVYNTFRKVDDAIVEILLKMGEQFEITGLIDRAELHLLSSKSLIENMHRALRLADRFKLEVLKKRCLKNITTYKDIKNLKRSESFKLYSNELKEDLWEKVAEICEAEENEKQN